MYPGIKGRPLAASGLQPGSYPKCLLLLWISQREADDYDCTTRDELKQAIIETSNGIAEDVLASVFTSWMTRIRWVIEHYGEYDRK
jgi:hypothetical protein